MATTHAFESEAQQSKNEGNKLFIAEQYLPAIDAYTRAINIITTQKVEETVEENPEEEKCKIEEVTDEEAAAITNKVEGLNMNDNSNTNNNNSSDTPNEPFTDTPAQVTAEPILPKTPQQELEEFVASVPADLRNLLSICYANRAACYLALENWASTISDCTRSLALQPTYTKPLLRRGKAYESTEKYSEALKDYQAVVDLDPSIKIAVDATKYLPQKIKEQEEKLKEEMIGKLKEVGNKFLGLFGLSTDNFKMQQDPATGGYSVNFKGNGQQEQ